MKYPEYVYWKPNPEFISELTDYLSNKKVLEIFAGNGYLASLLKDKNIDIKATSILSGMDGHSIKLFDDVENIKASSAVSLWIYFLKSPKIFILSNHIKEIFMKKLR